MATGTRHGDDAGEVRSWAGVGRHSVPDPPPGARWRRPIVARTAGAAAFVGLVAGGLMLVGGGSSAGVDGAVPTASRVEPTMARSSVTPVVPPPAPTPLTEPHSTQPAASSSTQSSPLQRLVRSPAGVLQLLVDARAHAWVTGDTADLGSALLAGSAAARSDRADLDAAHAGGMRYARLGFQVRSAHTTSTAGGVTHVLAVIDRSAYAVSGPGGTRTVSADAGERADVSLAWTSDGWRITAWRAA